MSFLNKYISTEHSVMQCERIPKGQSKMDNPEKLAKQGT